MCFIIRIMLIHFKLYNHKFYSSTSRTLEISLLVRMHCEFTPTLTQYCLKFIYLRYTFESLFNDFHDLVSIVVMGLSCLADTFTIFTNYRIFRENVIASHSYICRYHFVKINEDRDNILRITAHLVAQVHKQPKGQLQKSDHHS